MSNPGLAYILLRGGGDLASGIALRLHHAGARVIISELAQPLAVRRTVSFAQAVYSGEVTVEGLTARHVTRDQLQATIAAGQIPVMEDPQASILAETGLNIPVVIDARLTKHPPKPIPSTPMLHVGLGPGFHAGVNCHAAIETRRGHTLGRVYWEGTPQPDSGQPEGDPRRILRAPADGRLVGYAKIGERVQNQQLIAKVQDLPVTAPFSGVLRGLIYPGLSVSTGLKIGDVDPRGDPTYCYQVSDKALAIGGAVLEAILTKKKLRASLWS